MGFTAESFGPKADKKTNSEINSADIEKLLKKIHERLGWILFWLFILVLS